ncbi:MAG: Rid family detoxifying hydrolase [Flavobacteriaceae bacterium]|jgi:2-iminobutanoate/2-iminopropanoate deaminase|nr:Rid family detoxifying hydrolase [Flavobacteriaceae bacterium]
MKTIIQTADAPAPIGPYNQAVLVNNTLYASGQIALDPKTMTLVNDNIIAETKQVMKNIAAVLDAATMNFDNVVKTTIYLSNMNDFVAVNEEYSRFFNNKTAPARETVEVAGLPKSVNVEISVVAVL